MSQPAPAAPPSNEALVALERLYQKKVITLEEGQRAARLISRDESYQFPQPAPPPPPEAAAPAPAPGPAPAEAPAPEAQEQPPPPPSPGDGTSSG